MIIQDLLKDQIAVVTGGTRGIGYAIVQKFLEQGATVILFGSRQSSAEAAIAKLHSENPEYSVTGLAPDITDLTSVEQTFSQIVKEHKRIDILVNLRLFRSRFRQDYGSQCQSCLELHQSRRTLHARPR